MGDGEGKIGRIIHLDASQKKEIFFRKTNLRKQSLSNLVDAPLYAYTYVPDMAILN